MWGAACAQLDVTERTSQLSVATVWHWGSHILLMCKRVRVSACLTSCEKACAAQPGRVTAPQGVIVTSSFAEYGQNTFPYSGCVQCGHLKASMSLLLALLLLPLLFPELPCRLSCHGHSTGADTQLPRFCLMPVQVPLLVRVQGLPG